MEFDSSSEDEEAMVDAQSMTTKSSGKGSKTSASRKAPLIQVLASEEFANTTEESKDGIDASAVGQKRKFRDR